MNPFEACRRKHPRFPLSPSHEGVVEFGYPGPDDTPCCMRLLDISRGGISFVLAHDLPGLEAGDSIDAARVCLAGRVVQGDVVVMHLTPEATLGAVCGALFLPVEDADILAMRELLAMLDAEAAVPVP